MPVLEGKDLGVECSSSHPMASDPVGGHVTLSQELCIRNLHYDS